MRIAFLCSSAEPGRDGVGDYCRRLARELATREHQTLLIALNDRWYRPTSEGENRKTGELRCANTVSLASRMETVAAALRDFAPDWISLQYVCYGYHPKGWARDWNPGFAQLGKLASQRHLMLHELWSGEGGRPPLWHRVIGMGQRWAVHGLYRHFAPNLVTTSIPLFQQRLRIRGIPSTVLPLFGNIAIAPRDDAAVTRVLVSTGCRLVATDRRDYLAGVFFGAVHPDFDGNRMIRWLTELRRQARKPILLAFIGRGGKASLELTRQILAVEGAAFDAVSLGEQSETLISQTLRFADFGINTGSPELLGKSGTFAAMCEHGLPVVVADGELDPAVLRNGMPPVLQFSAAGSVQSLLGYSRPEPCAEGVVRTAETFLRLLETASGRVGQNCVLTA